MTSRRRFLGFGAGALAGCGGGVGGASIASPSAAPSPAPAARAFPVTYQFFGPEQEGMGYVLPSLWQFPGSALTPSTKLFRFDLGLPRAVSARFRLSWTTESTVQKARLVHFDDGPTNIATMAEIEGRGMGLQFANNQVVDVTAEFNALRTGPYKNLGFQLYGDGVSRFTLWEARLEVDWEVA